MSNKNDEIEEFDRWAKLMASTFDLDADEEERLRDALEVAYDQAMRDAVMWVESEDSTVADIMRKCFGVDTTIKGFAGFDYE